MKIPSRSMLLIAVSLVTAATVPFDDAAAKGGRGGAIYESHCAVCHGRDGRARTPVGHLLRNRPRNFADPVEMARVTQDRMVQAIKRGRPGTAMASWNGILTESEIADVMNYIRGLTPLTRLDPEQLSLEVGRLIYEKECAACHGASGHPDAAVRKVLHPSPRSFSDSIEMARIDDARMLAAITSGVDQSAMPAWGDRLTPAEIADVMRYIRGLAPPVPAGMKPQQLDILVGAQIYHRYCATCHGGEGDADTPLGRALDPRPWNFANAETMAGLSDEMMAQAITHGKAGTSMAPWGGILTPEDIRRVVMFIRDMVRQREQ
ncbi:MAG: c-type cytochrome [Myxococcota bacterium]